MAAVSLLAARSVKPQETAPVLETRAVEGAVQAGNGRLSGIGVRFGDVADLGDFTEEFREGAFVNLDAPDILFVAAHNPDRLLGRTGAGTLSVRSDGTGLAYEVRLPDTAEGRDARQLAERGDYAGVSVGFYPEKGGETWTTRNGRRHRTITRARLDHISPVSRPAYRSATLEV